MTTVTRVSEADSLTDIFVPQLMNTDTQNYPFLLFFLILLVLVCVLIYWYRQYTDPFRVLERQLVKQVISPREAAHRLAQIIRQKSFNDTDRQILDKLDRLRFQKPSPDIKDLQLIFRDTRA